MSWNNCELILRGIQGLIHSGALGLLLVLCLGVSPSVIQVTMCSARDQIQVSLMQDKCSQPTILSLWPEFEILFFFILIYLFMVKLLKDREVPWA